MPTTTLALLLRGFSGVALQTLLLRELLIVFCGSELTFGLMLSAWLLAGALGSMLAARLFRPSEEAQASYARLQMIFACVAPLAIIVIRLARAGLGVPLGEALNPSQILLITLLALAAPAALDGLMFSRGFRLLSAKAAPAQETKSTMAKMYLLESLGIAAGGLCFTFIWLPVFHAFQIALILSALQCLSARLLLPKTTKPTTTLVATAALAVSCALLASSDGLHRWTLNRQWRQKHLIAYKNSAYGNIAVTKEYSQFTVFTDGLPALSIPSPDVYFTEDFIHLPMLASHKTPRHALFIGTALGGLLEETLKYPLERVTYVEPDPVFLKIVSSLDDPLIRREAQAARLGLAFTDGRRFASNTKDRYDIVFVNTGLPTSLALNRYATKEFFADIKNILTGGGIAVFKTWGSLSALSAELKGMNAAMLKTLEVVFPYVSVIPGDGFNIFLASRTPVSQDAAAMAERAGSLGVQTSLINRAYLELRLNPSYAAWFSDAIKEEYRIARVNEDLRPTGLNEGLRLYYSQFSKKIPQWLEGLKKINALAIASAVIVAMGLWGWLRRRRKMAGALIETTVATTGMAAMGLQVAILLLFQSFFGTLYQWLAILTAGFMTGSCLGTLTALKKENGRTTLAKLAALEIIVPTTVFLLLGAIVFLGGQKTGGVLLLRWLFPAASAASGFLVGSEFPLVYELRRAATENSAGTGERLAGRLYGLDLIGACGGALLTPLILIPGCGILPTLWILFLLKITNGAQLLLFQLRRRV